MSQADYYQNGNHSACDTIHYQLSILNSQLLSEEIRNKPADYGWLISIFR
ncbi:MAG: hypothetical protein LBE12_17805 [Planctomycetaceae bacterium]|nr:hypothetical protein [Planctomycetaceae bacterium]